MAVLDHGRIGTKNHQREVKIRRATMIFHNIGRKPHGRRKRASFDFIGTMPNTYLLVVLSSHSKDDTSSSVCNISFVDEC